MRLTNPDAQTTSYRYDRVGNQVRVDYANNTHTIYTYNKRNWLTNLVNSSPRGIISTYSYKYDLVGNRISVTEADDSVVTYEYDYLYRLTKEERTGAQYYKATYTYDPVGNRLRKKETKRIIPTPGTADFDPNTFNINACGRWVRVCLAPMPAKRDKAWIIRINDTPIHPIKAERIRGNNVRFNRRSVAEASRPYVGSKVTYTVLWTIEDKLYQAQTDQIRIIRRGRPSRRPVPPPTTDLPPPLLTTTTSGYAYNRDNQLITETTNGKITTYAYDGNGNQVFKTKNGEVTTYKFDFENRLISVASNQSPITSYQYDGDGNRVSKITSVHGKLSTVNYVNDINLPLVQVLMETDARGKVLASYTLGNDLISMKRGTATTYYHYDGLGSTRQLTDNTGKVVASYTYDAFGNIIAQTGDDNPYTFTGEQFDFSTGLLFLRARYYDPSIGRFITKDPILKPMQITGVQLWQRQVRQLAGSSWFWLVPYLSEQPQDLHPYVYVKNNPINLRDPSGLGSVEQCRKEYLKCHFDCYEECAIIKIIFCQWMCRVKEILCVIKLIGVP